MTARANAQPTYDLSTLAGVDAAMAGTQTLLDSADDEQEISLLRFALRVLSALRECRVEEVRR